MRYLKLTIQRNRRRIQIEQLLLLLLRIALPVLLFLLLARPVLNPTGLEKWLGGGGRTSQIVLVDDSLSMGYAAGGPPAFHRAREVAGAVLGAANPQDRCTLVAASAPRTPVFHEVEGTRREELSGDALALPLSDTHAAWPTVLAGVDEVVQSCTYPTRNLTIVTDLRKSGWDAARRRRGPPLAGAGGARPGGRRGRRRGRQRRAPGPRPARPHDPRRGRDPLGGDDPQRLAPGAQPAPRRSSGSMTSRPR